MTETNTRLENRGLSNNQLKLIAMVTMFIDHVGHILLPTWTVLRLIGRISFPIFAYMIGEGCRYTKNRTAYFGKIAALALGCQVAYAVAEGSFHQGVLVTFSLSVLIIFSTDGFLKNKTVPRFLAAAAVLAGVVFLTVAAPRLFARQGFRVDYGLLGVLLPVAVYYAPGKWGKLLCAAVILALLPATLGTNQWFGLLALPLLVLYNGRRGKGNFKYAFYLFYPAHLALIYLVSLLVG